MYWRDASLNTIWTIVLEGCILTHVLVEEALPRSYNTNGPGSYCSSLAVAAVTAAPRAPRAPRQQEELFQ